MWGMFNPDIVWGMFNPDIVWGMFNPDIVWGMFNPDIKHVLDCLEILILSSYTIVCSNRLLVHRARYLGPSVIKQSGEHQGYSTVVNDVCFFIFKILKCFFLTDTSVHGVMILM